MQLRMPQRGSGQRHGACSGAWLTAWPQGPPAEGGNRPQPPLPSSGGPLPGLQHVVVLLTEQREAKQGVAERRKALGNEEQNHLVQGVYCEFSGALRAPGSERAVGWALW